MPRSLPLWPKPVPPKIRSIPDLCSTDFESPRQTRHRPGPAPPVSVLRRAPPLPHRASSRRSRLRQSSGSRIRPLPMLSGSPWSPTNLLLPTAAHAGGLGTFPLQFPRPPSSPEPVLVLPSGSLQISVLGHIVSVVASTSLSAPPMKPSLCAQVPLTLARWQMLDPPHSFVRLHLGPSTSASVSVPSQTSSRAVPDRRQVLALRN